MVAVSRVARGPARALIGRAREIDRGVDLVGGLIRETPREGRLATAGSIRMTLSLAFLAPDIVKAAVEGRLPRGYGLNRLVDRPMAGPDQWRTVGLRRQPGLSPPSSLYSIRTSIWLERTPINRYHIRMP
jgi:hypothetical protein